MKTLPRKVIYSKHNNVIVKSYLDDEEDDWETF